jgi:hypothetical protein
MTARNLSLALLAVLLAGCGGGVVTVCGQFDMPDYCKNVKTTSRTLQVQNACAAPVTIGASGAVALPGERVVRPGETAAFRLPIDADESVTWSGRVYAQEHPASYAEISLLADNADRYAVHNAGAIALAMKPDRAPRRTGMYAQVPTEYWCTNARGESTLAVCRADHAAANDLEYTITFCAP